MIARDRRSQSCEVAAALLMLAACGLPARWAWGWSGELQATLRDGGLNSADYARVELGYYEQICESGRSRKSLAPKPFEAGELAIVTADAREYVLKPNHRTLHRGAVWTTNEHGQRDRSRSIDKPPGTRRIALVGDSIGAGWGVDDEQTLTRLLERSMTRDDAPVEVLNFAVPGHAPGQRWEHFEKTGWSSSPDLVVFEGTAADLLWDERRIRAFVSRGLGGDSHVYGEFIRSIGLSPGESVESARAKLKPHREAILGLVYRTVVEDCRSRGVPCVWLLLPRVGKPVTLAERRRLADLAAQSGFAATIDLSDAFEGLDPASLAIAPDDFHPNAGGHAMLSRRLGVALSDLEATLLQPSQGPTPGETVR